MKEEESEKPVIGISIGDINGIGPEIIIKTLSDSRILNFCTPVIYGSGSAINYHRKAMDNMNFNVNVITSAHEAHPRKVNLINCWDENTRINFGQESTETGEVAFLSIRQMVSDARDGKLDAMVTAPISKLSIQSEDFKFPGHTEYLAQELGSSEPLMFMVGEHFRIGVATGHIPLSEVSKTLTEKLILKKLRIMNESLITDFCIRKPVIGVLGLNPHAGENGLLGTEEQEVIIPAIEKAKAEGIMALGPYPADGFFGNRMYEKVDAVLAMYHDQGLAPFKLVSFQSGVNYTAGLSVPRTSPDHGTGFAIAGKNVADEQSFREAVYMACDIVKNRALYEEVTSNPLKSQLVKEKEI